MTTFQQAVNAFQDAAESWLTPEDAPALVSLQRAAEELDEEITPALLSAFNLTYRALLKRKPEESAGDVDELDDLIPQ